MRDITCCFTGHRPEKLPWRENESDERCTGLKSWMREQIIHAYENGYRRFVCGMARGADLYFCEAALALRDTECADITVEAAVPWDGQSDSWPSVERRRYSELLKRCDIVTHVQHNYTPDCLMRRNRYMVDQSSHLICAYNGEAGGTRNTLLYAMRNGLTIMKYDIACT